MEPLQLRIFLSSPGDVQDERNLARQVLRRLENERTFRQRIELEEVSWDDPDQSRPLDAHLTPQQAIDRALGKPSDCDIVVVILWSRMGTPLPDQIKKPDGSTYRSGTEYEFLEAIASAEKTGKPSVWLYRRDEVPKLGMEDSEFDEKRRQWVAVKEFFGKFKDPNGSLKRTVFPYPAPSDFQDLFEGHLRDRISELLQEAGKLDPANRSGRSEDGVLERSAGRAPNSGIHPVELSRYLQAAVAQCETLPIAGFKTKARVAIRLDELYVPLRAMVDNRFSGDSRFADAQDAEERLLGRGAPEIPLSEAFTAALERKRRGLVILGDPGSGKTTQLKRLLLACFREGPESLGLPAETVPVFLPLRDLRQLDQGVDAFIETSLANPHLAMDSGFGKRLLDRGQLLLLFDGLDEVSDPDQRAKVSRWIEAVARNRPTCFPVVTCRFAGYSDDARLGGESFLEMHVRPLTPDESGNFIRNWYRAVKASQDSGPASQAEAEAEAARLIARLREPDYRSTRMAEMTRNPLLLANLCLVHYDRKGELPKGRHELYDECIDVLLELWRRDHKGLGSRVPARIGKDVLGPVALWLHGEENRNRASLNELRPVLDPALAAAGWQGDAKDFLTAVRDESGLLTGWSGDRYGFMHLGFQEYLAARELRRRIHREALAGAASITLGELAGHYGESWWQEVILLLLAEGDPAPLFAPFMREAIHQPLFASDASLLGLILEEAGEKTAAPFEAWLRHAISQPVPHEQSAEWQRLLNVVYVLKQLMSQKALDELIDEVIGMARPGMRTWLQQRFQQSLSEQAVRVTDAGGVEQVLIPGGEFMMGSPRGQGRDSEYPQHEVSIQSFYLGRYPVTNEEYGRFLQANTGNKEPAYWGDRRFNQARRPVVGVDWEDARRFCEWAGGRLPTEAEWEYACRAGSTTEYFWGDDDPATADTVGLGLAEDSAHTVGEKQPNPWGIYDMTGNEWEWQQDVWHDNYAGAPTDGSAWETGDSSRRVIRGGSWGNAPGNLRSALRSGIDPGTRFYSLGFRLARDLP